MLNSLFIHRSILSKRLTIVSEVVDFDGLQFVANEKWGEVLKEDEKVLSVRIHEGIRLNPNIDFELKKKVKGQYIDNLVINDKVIFEINRWPEIQNRFGYDSIIITDCESGVDVKLTYFSLLLIFPLKIKVDWNGDLSLEKISAIILWGWVLIDYLLRDQNY